MLGIRDVDVDKEEGFKFCSHDAAFLEMVIVVREVHFDIDGFNF